MLLCVGDTFGSDDKEWRPYSEGAVEGNIRDQFHNPNLLTH